MIVVIYWMNARIRVILHAYYRNEQIKFILKNFLLEFLGGMKQKRPGVNLIKLLLQFIRIL